jgi:PRTRC genetic system ThiF family protein
MNRKSYLAPDFRDIYLIGVGGTGGYLAQGLAKLVSGYKLDVDVILIDPDYVEEKNCARQNFWHYEIEKPKAYVLSTRLNQQYGLKFGASSLKGEDFMAMDHGYSTKLVITCVDSVSARKAINPKGAWLDLGNGKSTGQAIFGTTSDPGTLDLQKDHWLLSPHTAQLPNAYHVGDLDNAEDEPDVPSCADQPFAEQGVFTNEWAAQAGLSILMQLLVTKELLTPQIYFDCITGRMNPLYITKEMFNGVTT